MYISEKKIDLNELINQAHHPEAGGIVIFSGETRNHSNGKKVDYLEYEAHVEMAEKSIAGILEEAMRRWPLKKAMAVHRIGRVDISEPAVVVITVSAHRKQAYEANIFIIDSIKKESPIWKKEFFTDGGASWG